MSANLPSLAWNIPPPAEVHRQAWPTMYDLPSEDHEEPGLPDLFHHLQPNLLEETFCPPNYPADQVFVATDLNLYYDRNHPLWQKRPDWFAVLGVPHLYHGHDLRFSYVIWDEQVKPFIVMELLSPGTEEEDLGETVRTSPTQPPTKWEVYEQILQIPYYVVFSRYATQMRLFKLTPQGYREISLLQPRFWFTEIQLGLGVWLGRYNGAERLWLRWYDANNEWIPTKEEAAEYHQQESKHHQQEAQLAKQQAIQAKQQAVQAKQQAIQAEQRATQAEQQLEELKAKLRTLGMMPEQL